MLTLSALKLTRFVYLTYATLKKESLGHSVYNVVVNNVIYGLVFKFFRLPCCTLKMCVEGLHRYILISSYICALLLNNQTFYSLKARMYLLLKYH